MGEIRDTTNPGLVTEMLMAILASLGQPVVCKQIQKRTRDDVLWNRCLLPRRRSPLWLGIRVALQRTLVHALGSEEGILEYKNFMILLITEIASQASAANLPDDLCHVIVAKVARRASKLASKVFVFVQDRALNVCQTIHSKRKRTWEVVCDQDGKRPTTVDSRSFERDTGLSLDTSKDHIDVVLKSDDCILQTHAYFDPNHNAWLGLHRGLPSLDGLGTTNDEDIYTLAEFEAWISGSLLTWRHQRLAVLDSDDCMALANLATKYRDKAMQLYDGAPEQISTMILVIAELWHTLDILASAILPLLKNFSPEITSNFLDPLLLPKQAQMQRLREIELYVAARHIQASTSNPSVFSDPVQNAFAVQFYASSAHHQALRDRIERDASVKRTQKEVEWKSTSDQYERLKEDAKRRSCQCDDDERCRKCQINGQADAMTIDVYEWPLPDGDSSCQSALFELDCPTEFAAWRNLTWMLIHDIGRQASVRGDSPAAELSTYDGLRTYSRQSDSRLTLASKTKPLAKSHYRILKLPVALDRCFSKNALHYELFDAGQRCWITDQVNDPNLHAKCVTSLPDGPYSNLQYAVDSVAHSQNQVIADQETCSKSLSLHEFLSFGSLRADGERVQWQNIKRELAASNLSLNTQAVCILITQAAWQVGSEGSSSLRNAHLDLQNPSFCTELLMTARQILDSISANWKSDDAMLLLITVVLRVLSLSSDMNVNTIAIDMLQKMRLATGQWTNDLASTLHETIEPNQILRLQQRLLKAAILCKMTFDVDTRYVQKVMNNANDLELWAKSSMHVRDNLPGEEAGLPKDLRRLLLRDRKVSRALYRVVHLLVIKFKCKGLELAIAQRWVGFQPHLLSWTAFGSPNDRWLRATTASTPNQRSQQVHYNVLEGELLVDGRPLGRLPTNYIRDKLYLRLFDAQTLHVFSSDMDGMLYMSAQAINGYHAHFGKRGQEIVIRVRKGSQILELVPQQHFARDLPSLLIDDYFHWLDVARQEIEFRPSSQRWESNLNNWRLRYQPGGTSHLLLRDKKLMDIRSETFARIMDIFTALEVADHVHVTWSNDQRLEVALPRYDLHFFLNHDEEFQCHELGKIVDPDQSVGTFIELKSRLVLCGVQKLARKYDRIVLIPAGQVSFATTAFHVEATITVPGREIRLLQYQIDATLCRLQGGADMYATIYKAYLHAITSNTVPDPFTRRTGTEEAPNYLQQRSMGFAKPPDDKTISLLKVIADLTPRRAYYPNHLKVMQQVRWNPTLSMILQHDDFLPLAERIAASGNSYAVFYPDSRPSESLYISRDLHLLERAKIRNSCFRNPDFGGHINLHDHDFEYKARDCVAETARGQKSFEIASLVQHWPNKLQISDNLSKDLQILGTVSGFGTQFDPYRPLSELLDMKFASSWAPLHQLCLKVSPTLDTYRLLFLFSIIAYGSRITSLTALRTLLAFAFISQVRKVSVPLDHSYIDLRQGEVLDEDVLRRTIWNHMSQYNGPGSRKHRAQWDVENKKHEAISKEEAKAVLQKYKAQWPISDPIQPSELLSLHLNWSTAKHQISALFYIWTANGKFSTYLNQIQPILDEAYAEQGLRTYNSKDWHLSEKQLVACQHGAIPSLVELMSQVSPAISLKPEILRMARLSMSVQKNEKLEDLIAAIRSHGVGRSQHSLRTQYRDDLLASYQAFSSYTEQITSQSLPCALTDVLLHRMTCESTSSRALNLVHECLGAKSLGSTLLAISGLWPRITILSLLATLSSKSLASLSPPWRQCLLALGENMTALQRARRLVLASERNDVSTFCVEVENEGHQGWDLNQWPDWLLIEIEGDFLIRPMQARVALEMIKPASSTNSLVQLNMGKYSWSIQILNWLIFFKERANLRSLYP